MNKFFGTGIAMVTPFNADGSVDYNGLKNLIDFLIGSGAEYLVSLGTTGESATLSKDEKKEIWRFTAKTVAGRVPLVAGIGGNNTLDVISSIKEFDIKGYDAILSASPHYNKPTQEGIYQHYKLIAENSELPILLYNVPSRTGSNITAETILRLAHDFSKIIGIKEASGNFEQFNKIAKDKPESFLFISGDDPVTLPMIALGAVGVISVVGNAFPKQLSDMVRLCLDQQFTAAKAIHSSLLEITRLCFVDGSPAGVKAVLKELGICSDTVRLPLVNINSDTYRKIEDEVSSLAQAQAT